MTINKKSFGSNTVDDYNRALGFCRKYLPKQGPLEYFVHHNTLHSFEEYNFFDALKYASSLYEAKTAKSLTWYQRKFSSNRISKSHLMETAQRYLSELDESLISEILFWNNDYKENKSSIAKSRVLELLGGFTEETPEKFRRISSFWTHVNDKSKGEYVQGKVFENKTNFLSSYFDKGNAYWQMEGRDAGMLSCFQDFVKYLPATGHSNHLKRNLAELDMTLSHDIIITSLLNKLKIPCGMANIYLFQTIYKLRGWAALVFALEENDNYNPTHIKVNINEFVLICLLFEVSSYDYLSASNILEEYEYEYLKNESTDKRIHSYIFDVLKKKNLENIISFCNTNEKVLKSINEGLLLKIWHEAYELSLIRSVTHSYTLARGADNTPKRLPKIQVVTCIDDREESTRRHFEEYESDIETFGYAGHFGLNINYKSIRETHFRGLCPLSASPDFYVWEEVKGSAELKTSKLSKLKFFLFHNSNLPIVGLILTLLLGPLSLMLFLFESIAPNKIHKIRKKLKRLMFPKVETTLNYLKESGREFRGYTLDETVAVVLNMLKTIGITDRFAPVIFLCGHGSKSMNNPHGAAYNCGACAGGKGAPNGRLMALMANKSEVRAKIRSLGVNIPDDTYFIGGYHCTSSDKILIFDKELYPENLICDLVKACKYVEENDAKERLRKFHDVKLGITSENALIHASNRSYDFSQPRPEYGHNTNAFCIVGDRKSSKEIFFDRRAFLVTYCEREDDQECNNLLGLLSAVIPVCAGINLEYYFSYVDREIFGAGVKQAHNVTSLMGVMNGARSDLRLGLPWQMVEIHEPTRVICIIETSPEAMIKIMSQNQGLLDLIENEWVRVITVNKANEYFIFQDGEFCAYDVRPSGKEVSTLKESKFVKHYEHERDLCEFIVKENA